MTPIIDLLNTGFSLSVELWPPRSAEAQVRLERSLERLRPLRPTFASITYGAAGSTRERTHDLVVAIHESKIMTPMAHLVCAAHRRAELVAILERYRSAGIENVLALRGDPPLDAPHEFVEGELPHAIDLVDLAKEIGNFCVAVGAHPEGHPDAPDRVTDRRYLAEKLTRADFAITQFFFRTDDYRSLVSDLAELGVSKPVIPGIMPITNIKTVSRMAELSGTELPAEVRRRIGDVSDDPEAVRRVGVDIATELCRELVDEGVPGLHFYTMNQVSATLEICDRLGLVERGA